MSAVNTGALRPASLVLLCALATSAVAEDTLSRAPQWTGDYDAWMADDVPLAWSAGLGGQGSTIIVVDDFAYGARFSGYLGEGMDSRTHGGWTAEIAHRVAPAAEIIAWDYHGTAPVGLSSGFAAINLSYDLVAPAGRDPDAIDWSEQERALITYARAGAAFVAKAAGNDGIEIGRVNGSGDVDYLGLSLIGSRGTIFVGALSGNGAPGDPAALSGYSNIPGSNRVTREQFLVVGVEGARTGLYGTSFAAPIVAGYGAILSTKFPDASAPMVARQLLDTARTDTIAGYSVALHGQGEACLSCALAPSRID